MANTYKQNSVTSSETRFTNAPMGELEFSTMVSTPTLLTTFNGGDIVPIYCAEVLPHDTFKIDLDFVVRQATVAVPTMGALNLDIYAFFVPNRVVNKSWKNVMGENTAGAWTQQEDIILAPLATAGVNNIDFTVPIGSVADYYGIPTQYPIRKEIFMQMHDLKYRGYIECYNTYFRDQNYQPPIAYSKLNIYQGFLHPLNAEGGYGLEISPAGNSIYQVPDGTTATGQFGSGAVVKELFGEGGKVQYTSSSSNKTALYGRKNAFCIFDKPFKANKLHDYFTSVLPSPQRGQRVYVGLSGNSPLDVQQTTYEFSSFLKSNNGTGTNWPLRFRKTDNEGSSGRVYDMVLYKNSTLDGGYDVRVSGLQVSENVYGSTKAINGTNLVATFDGAQLSLDDIRSAAAIQQYYEILGRGGGRYKEFINSFFGLDIDDPFSDIPVMLGHIRRELDLFQTAQTSASPSSSAGAGTAQGNLAAFGYTNKGGSLFHYTFKEHGYVHIFAVVRHKNVYSSTISRDNFRLSALDFYSYPLANITEQPVYTREINPFVGANDLDDVFGYQEAWAEYRMEPSRVTGQMRPQKQSSLLSKSLSYWNYADEVDRSLLICDKDWLVSNTEEIVRRSTAIQDSELPQFKGQFMFNITKERPMPTYSVAGLDII